MDTTTQGQETERTLNILTHCKTLTNLVEIQTYINKIQKRIWRQYSIQIYFYLHGKQPGFTHIILE